VAPGRLPPYREAQREGCSVVFLDETGVTLQPVRRRTWAPRGQTPLQGRWQRYERLSVISALTWLPTTSASASTFVCTARTSAPRRSWSSSGSCAATSAGPSSWCWIARASTGPRSAGSGSCLAGAGMAATVRPRAQPGEYVWNRTEYGDLANYLADDLLEVELELGWSLEQSRHRPELLRSFYHAARLGL